MASRKGISPESRPPDEAASGPLPPVADTEVAARVGEQAGGRRRSVFRERAEYFALTAALGCFSAVPPRVAHAAGIGLGRLAYALLRGRRRIALENLRLVWGSSRAESELRGIARGSFESLGRLVADFAQMGRWEASDLDRHVRWEGWEHYQKAQARGRGVLYLAAHFGSWEVVSFAQSLRGAPMAFIVRPADNLRIEALVRARRERHGNAVIPKRSALRDCLRRLKRGETVGILIDQHVPAESGVVSQLLGQPVYTTSALALLALRTGAPVLPAFALRQADGTQRIILGPEIDLERSGDPARDVIVATQRFNEAVERFIAERPDHWLWAHRRFRAAAHAGGGTPRGTQAE